MRNWGDRNVLHCQFSAISPDSEGKSAIVSSGSAVFYRNFLAWSKMRINKNS
jgi:hypothetical protein